MSHWIALAAAITVSLFGQTLLKAGALKAEAVSAGASPAGAGESFLNQLLEWHTLLGLCLYGGAALLYIVALRRLPMSVALPCTAASYVAAALIGHFAYAEPIGSAHIGALVLISAGVVLLALA